MEGRLKLLMVAALTLLVAVTSHAFPATLTFKDDFNPAKPVVWVEGNGYRNVTVGVRDDLLEGDCEMLLDSLKAVTREASRLLHQVTHGTLYFEEVTILLPSTWACSSVPPGPSTPLTWREGHIIVGPTHPVFKDASWTQQPRGCGQEGDFIYLTEQWLKSYQQHADESSGKELVAQWARYRWGVFGEEGYLGDAVHPPSYLHLNASSLSWNPTLCHNGDLQGDFSGSCEAGDSANCSFSINAEASRNVTSSLMALPNLQSVLEFCDEDTHNAAVPTKHNLMCSGSSIWQVISRHPDLFGREVWVGDVEPTFRVQRAEASTQPSHVDMVLVLQYTSTMAETLNRWKFLRDAVRKFLLVEAPKGTKIGLVMLSDSAVTLAGLTTLTDFASRLSLANKVPQNPTNTSATKNLEAGITEAVNILDGNGLVVLVVENLSNHTSETSENLVAAAGNTSVWAVLYPHLPSVSASLYQDLVDATNGSLLTVVNPYGPMYQSVDDLAALNNQLRTILSASLEPHSVWIKKDEALCLANCFLTLEVDNKISYQSEIILELFFLSFDAAGLKNIEMKAPDGTVLTPSAVDSKYETIRHHFYTQAQVQQTGNYTVMIERLTYVDGVMVSLLVMPRPPVVPVVWASEPLLELHQSNSSVPTLFVQLWQGERYIVKATVTATISFSGANVTLLLRDDGTRGDVTGGDGIYSGMIVGVVGQAEVNILAHDNGGAALLVGSYSSLTLASRVTDLNMQYSADGLSLHFTASGEDYYSGEAVAYEVTHWTSLSSKPVVEVFSAPPATADSQITLVLSQNECDVLYVFTVCALDSFNTKSEVSNEARFVIPCDYTTNDTQTTASSESPTDVSTTSHTTSGSDSPRNESSTTVSYSSPQTPTSDSSTRETSTLVSTSSSELDSSTAETTIYVSTSTPQISTSVSASMTSQTTTTTQTTSTSTTTDKSSTVSSTPTPQTSTSVPDTSTAKTSTPAISSTTLSTTKTHTIPTTTSTSSTTEASSSSSDNKIAIFLGSVFGGLLFLALAGIAAEYIYRRVSLKSRKRS
ncbi:mucin-22-like isoform X2 [Portunus trituberculatus]|uniref:mucin-22-like isoform X2 n=1 Tax=Portunus trituberculatus TaxID=210409 RepID=UPI001E1CD20F|nr:mucin-22-like isoform X2 [Portunus trituberculatus]